MQTISYYPLFINIYIQVVHFFMQKISYSFLFRSVANEVINLGRVSVNGKVVKPSYEVKVGDIVGVQFGDKISKFEILSIPRT